MVELFKIKWNEMQSYIYLKINNDKNFVNSTLEWLKRFYFLQTLVIFETSADVFEMVDVDIGNPKIFSEFRVQREVDLEKWQKVDPYALEIIVKVLR